ncbi:DUF2919 family protein [Salmonella enterica subsp. enterica serovar Thompson]|nr:DUF2919 family protein [Salmonella enterica subsp. enterica]EBH8640823.1 DUF2919 family protein [Salmonella enterica subsp. enterica serovar Thompson]EBR2769132.1 DUF2919 domain-containing protein [Salmonella enterica]EED9464867.1 DUF2919 domain-containing protein [Salmonella enterica subsp. enterica serovar Abaetetuba]EBT4148424.1 DUF2919 domain-containing protein [Salmonella enterica subsp. enterica]
MTGINKWCADDYDNRGQLKVKMSFWIALIIQFRAILLLFGAGLGDDYHWFSVLYPDEISFYYGILSGLPALMMLFLYPVREKFASIASALYWVLFVVSATSVVKAGLGYYFHQLEDYTLILELIGMVLIWPDRRLRSIFIRKDNDFFI